MTDTDASPKSPVSQTLLLRFTDSPSWGDLYWFVEQAKAAGITNGETIDFEWDFSDERDPNPPMIGMSFTTHPDPADLLND